MGLLVVKVVVGLLSLAFGRKLYWLFVGAMGFLAASTFVARAFGGLEPWLMLAIALGVGLLGAVLAVALKSLGIALGGFVAGGALAAGLLSTLGWSSPAVAVPAFVLGGVVGVALVVGLFDWALIALSSLGGATLVMQAVRLRPPVRAVAFVVIAMVGMVIQGNALARERR
jgi:hypothetical protein